MKVFSSIHFTRTRDQRAEYFPWLARELEFVAVLPQFPGTRIEVEWPKCYFRRSRGPRNCRIAWWGHGAADDIKWAGRSISYCFHWFRQWYRL